MNSRNLTSLLGSDAKLRVLFSGILFCAVSLLTIIISAGMWLF